MSTALRLPSTVRRGARAVGLRLELYARRLGPALWGTVRDFDRHDYLTHAAALSFFYLLALFPLLIFLASLLAYVPLPNLFDEALDTMGRLAPGELIDILRGVMRDMPGGSPELLSVSAVATVLAASGGFSAMITALNIAYDVPEGRPFWRRRLVALALTILVGVMVTIAVVAMTLGPQFGSWLAAGFGVDPLFAKLWPAIRWAAALILTVLSVEVLYLIGPNIKQRFAAQVPGAIVAVAGLVLLSNGFGWYLRYFADYGKTYGALGAVVALILWQFLGALAILAGAELNGELLKLEAERDAKAWHAHAGIPDGQR